MVTHLPLSPVKVLGARKHDRTSCGVSRSPSREVAGERLLRRLRFLFLEVASWHSNQSSDRKFKKRQNVISKQTVKLSRCLY